MFGTIRKHQSWLWFVIIAIVILSMITWQNQLGKSGNQPGSPGNFGSIGNKPITASEFQSAKNEASLMYLMRTRQWPDAPGANSSFDLEREAYQRLFLIRKLDEYNVHSDSDTVAQLATMFLREFGNNGQPASLDTLLEQLKVKGITAEDFQKFLEHDLSIQQLAGIVGIGGKLVTPAEIQSLYEQEYQELAADAVFFSASNYLSKIQEPTPEALSGFYTNQQPEYREPDQMQVSYAFFNVTNFMPQAEQQIGTNLNREAEEALTRMGTNGLKFGKTADEAKAKIRELLIQDVAISNAYLKAVAFQNELVAKEPLHAEYLGTLAKEKGVDVKVTKPFDKEYWKAELMGQLNLDSSFPGSALFNLTPEEPFVDQPIRGLDGVYVLAYDKLTPSRIPPLEEIRSRVVSDYRYAQAMRLAQLNGRVFAQTVTNELAHGKTFAATASASRLEPVTLPPFSLTTETLPAVEEYADLTTFKNVAFTNSVGSVSAFAPTRGGGFVVYVRQRLPIDQAKMKAQLPEFSNAVRQRRQSEAFELWFNREASAALRDIPLFQSRSRPGAMR